MIDYLKKTVPALALTAGLLGAGAASAVPITYAGDLTGGALLSSNELDVDDPNDTSLWSVGNLWTLSVVAGDVITVTARRLTDIDLILTIWDGLENDTMNYIGRGAYGNASSTNYVTMGDDELPANVPGPAGGFGDPQASFTAATTGIYTVGVFGLDGAAGVDHSYTVQAAGATGPAVGVVPLPAGLPLLFAGLAGLGLIARRRKS